MTYIPNSPCYWEIPKPIHKLSQNHRGEPQKLPKFVPNSENVPTHSEVHKMSPNHGDTGNNVDVYNMRLVNYLKFKEYFCLPII